MSLDRIQKLLNTMSTTLVLLLSTLVLFSSCETADWTDQANWGGDCNGADQSPINIDPRDYTFCEDDELNFIELNCNSVDNSESLDGDTLGTYQVEAQDSGLVFTSTQFSSGNISAVATSSSFQFHAPSEHTIKGNSFDLQFQVIFNNLPSSQWQSQVQGSEIDEQTSFTQQQIITRINSGSTTVTNKVIVAYLFQVDDDVSDTDIFGLDDETKTTNIESIFECASPGYFYRYRGSMTVPPCTEGVQWFIARRPMKISQQQLDFIKTKIAENNNRNIQQLGDRPVRIAGIPCHAPIVQ